MNWLDIVLLLVLVGSVATSFSTGLTREVVGLLSIVAALVLAIWFYGTAGSFLQPYVSSPGVSNFCGFLLVFFGVLILGAIVGRVLGRLMKVSGLSFVDRLLGAGFGAVRGLLVSVALVLALLALIVTSAQQMVTPWAIVQQSAVSLSPELFSYDEEAGQFSLEEAE